MSGSITIWPGYHFTRAPVDLIAALNLLAVPTARIDEAAVGTPQLVAADVVAIASALPARPRVARTLPADVVVASYTRVSLGTVTLTGAAVGDRVVTSQPVATCMIHGQVLTTNTVTLYADCMIPFAQTIPAGIVIQVLKL